MEGYIVLWITNLISLIVGYLLGGKLVDKEKIIEQVKKIKNKTGRVGAIKIPSQSDLIMEKDPILKAELGEMKRAFGNIFKRK